MANPHQPKKMPGHTLEELSTLKAVDIRTIWPDEAKNFTPWLFDHIATLGSALGIDDLEAEVRESAVGGYKLDILGSDRDRKVVIENQLGETDHSHLGQLLTYMAGHQANVAIWVASKFRDEHKAALDLLNSRTGTDEDSEFFGVVVEAWRIGDSPAAPHFTVVCAPNGWTKTKKISRAPSEQSQRYLQFFQQLIDTLGASAKDLMPSNPNARSWLSFRNEYKGFGYNAAFTGKDGGRAQIELYIDCGDKETNKKRFDILRESKEQIESDIKGEFDWQKLETKKACRISAVKPGYTIDSDQEGLKEVRDWMAKKLVVFKKTFDVKLAELTSQSAF